MRSTLIIAAALTLTGCISSVGGPTKLPGYASGAMWTVAPSDTITSCIAQAVGASANGNIITAPSGNRYEVVPARDRKGIYKTQVNVTRSGHDTQEEQSQVAICVAAAA